MPSLSTWDYVEFDNSSSDEDSSKSKSKLSDRQLVTTFINHPSPKPRSKGYTCSIDFREQMSINQDAEAEKMGESRRLTVKSFGFVFLVLVCLLFFIVFAVFGPNSVDLRQTYGRNTQRMFFVASGMMALLLLAWMVVKFVRDYCWADRKRSSGSKRVKLARMNTYNNDGYIDIDV